MFRVKRVAIQLQGVQGVRRGRCEIQSLPLYMRTVGYGCFATRPPGCVPNILSPVELPALLAVTPGLTAAEEPDFAAQSLAFNELLKFCITPRCVCPVARCAAPALATSTTLLAHAKLPAARRSTNLVVRRGLRSVEPGHPGKCRAGRSASRVLVIALREGGLFRCWIIEQWGRLW
jgi:hypothetical protein